MSDRLLSLRFPLGGLHRNLAFQSQPPYTTPDCMNVRPVGVFDERQRGGSRPGVGKAYYEELGSGTPVRMLATVPIVRSDGYHTWMDSFESDTLSDVWSTASWIGTAPPILNNWVTVETDENVGAVRTSLGIDTTQPYEIKLFIAPYLGAYHGTYSIFFRLNDTTPRLTTAGARATISMQDSIGTYSGALTVYPGGTNYPLTSGVLGYAESGWFSVVVDGNNVKVYWLGMELLDQTIAAPSGQRLGFGMECMTDGGLCLADSISVDYYTGTGHPRQRILVASAGGTVYRTTMGGHLTEVVADPTLASDRHVSATDRAQLLFIADYGDVKVDGTDGTIAANEVDLDAAGVADWTAYGIDTDDDVCVITNGTGAVVDGTYAISAVIAGKVTLASSAGGAGTCAYRIERGPKVYDPSDDSVALWQATTGQVPTGCPLIALYRDRLVMGGSALWPHLFYMSRQTDPYDWDYGADANDAGRAIGAATGDFGKIGRPLTAIIPHSDDYLVFGTDTELWVLRGDPAFGGEMDNLSTVVGVVGSDAWCRTPEGSTIVLSHRGLYRIPPGMGSPPEALSDHLPQELRSFNALDTVSLAYDVSAQGIHIYVTPQTAGTQGGLHWWFDAQQQSFWPLRLPGDCDPTAVLAYVSELPTESAVLLGGRDGYVRRYRLSHETDEGTEIASYVDYGPIPVTTDRFQDGLVAEVVGNIASESGHVDWSLHVGHSEQDAAANAAFASGTWQVYSHGGVNYTDRPRARGKAFRIRLANGESNRAWAVEDVRVRVRPTGPHRLL